MLIYVSLDFLIIVLGILFTKTHVKLAGRNINGRVCFFVLSSVLLIFISGFRGNFTTDYNGYVNIYDSYKYASMISILRRGYFANPETGYVLFQYIIGSIFRGPLFIFVVSSIIIVLSNLYHLNKYDDDLFIGTLLFLEAGIFFTSFNLMRQCLAASIIVLGSGFLYERKTWQYMLVILLASTFHISALIMIPFYFLSTFKLNKNFFLYAVIIAIFIGIAPAAAHFIQSYYWSWHVLSDYGGYSWKNIVLPAAISIFTFVSYSNSNKKNTECTTSRNGLIMTKTNIHLSDKVGALSDNINNIWLNATIVYFTFILLGMWFSLANRFSTFFSIYALSLFGKQIERSKYSKILKIGTVVLLVTYGVITKIGDFPYYFIWEK